METKEICMTDKAMHMRKRARELITEILARFKPFYVRRIERVLTGNPRISYVIVTRKASGAFIERLKEFVLLLQGNLENEVLIFKNKCFKVVGDGYAIQFVFEGYKRSNMYGSMENGVVEAKLLHRMGCFMAVMNYIKKCSRNIIPEIQTLMSETEYVSQYPCPGDRFVAICKKKVKLLKESSLIERNDKISAKDIKEPIIELRTSPDGDLDWTANCWAAKSMLIMTITTYIDLMLDVTTTRIQVGGRYRGSIITAKKITHIN